MSHAVVPLGIEPKVWSNAATARRSTVSGFKPDMMVFSGSSAGKRTGFHPVRLGGGEGGGRPTGAKVENKMVTKTAEVMEREKERRQDPELPVIGDESHDVSSVSTTPKIDTSRKRKPSGGGSGNKKSSEKSKGRVKKKKTTTMSRATGSNTMKARIKRLAAARRRNGGGSSNKPKRR